MNTNQPKASFAANVRNFIFGVEDSLVSTVGLLSGVSIAGLVKSEIILTGAVLIFVEAFSMGAGSFLSESSAEEYLENDKSSFGKSAKRGIVMFFSYFLAGFIPLLPYLLLEGKTAFWWSVAVSILALFVLGVTSGKILKSNILKTALRMVVIGGIAIGIGILTGSLIK